MRVTYFVNESSVAGRLAMALFVAAATAVSARGQQDAAPVFVAVGSTSENYLRYAQTLGQADYPGWTIRPLARSQLTLRDSGWARRTARAGGRVGALEWIRLPVVATAWYNSTYPFGWNDGAVWRGRGTTAALEFGGSLSWRFVSATLNPIAFVAENRDFPLMTPAATGVNPFSDPLLPKRIDRPQRFGEKSYGRVDPGQSTIRIDAAGLAVGVSTSNLWLGPMAEWPYLLGNNASGFPHLFAGSSSPWNIGIGRVHGRLFYGRVAQSPYSNAPDTGSSRLISGLAGSFSPRFFPGLEVGGARVFTYYWPTVGLGWKDARKPLEGLLKERLKADVTDPNNPNQSVDNQLASLFARWVLPRSGFEIYGEYGRDDHNWNALDAVLEPDHSASYGFGARKAWRRPDNRLAAFRLEVINFEPSTILRHRPAGNNELYAHAYTIQGHTSRGQVLGAGFGALSGAGAMVGFDRFDTDGDHSSVVMSRLTMRERTQPSGVDVSYSIAVDREQTVRGVRFSYGLTGVYELNRYFRADVGNVMVTLGLLW